MNVLGISSGFAPSHVEMGESWPIEFTHDSAVAVVRDGVILAAVEEERLNRVKHTNKFPQHGVRACLDVAGLRPDDLDGVAYFWSEADLDSDLGMLYAARPQQPLRFTRELLLENLNTALGRPVLPEDLHFVKHHLAHAGAGYFGSGFSDALVVVMDGGGENDSITVMSASGNRLEPITSFSIDQSLGVFYATAIQLLGYGLFDEYKVMGLAPFGNADRYRSLFEQLYDLNADGSFSLDVRTVLPHFLRKGFKPRRRGEHFNQDHRDFAAALQETLETIASHVITFNQRATGHTRLCMSGGVALNCTMGGRLLRSANFTEMYIDPASHDAGASAGAAQYICSTDGAGSFSPAPLEHVYLGPSIGTSDEIRQVLDRWSGTVDVRRVDDAPATAAQMIADGRVIGWVQGRSEFGPRALGHRSILADPRPAGNRDRINAIVKRRESYRPFAPAVTEEASAEFFEVPPGMPLHYMVAAVPVRPEKREVLGAVTHIDGSARLQVVQRRLSLDFWRLIDEFGRRTGVPVVLNTSFNNDVEPIVDSVEDALVCFLTTALDALIVGPYLVTKKPAFERGLLDYSIRIPVPVSLEWSRQLRPGGDECGRFRLRYQLTGGRSAEVSTPVGSWLQNASLPSPFSQLVDHCRRSASPEETSGSITDSVVGEVVELWTRRMIILLP